MKTKYLRPIIALFALVFYGLGSANGQNIITTVTGNGTGSSTGDGGCALAATIAQDVMLALGPNGDLYIGDVATSKVRKITLSTGIISTVAGTSAGFGGDGGPATSAQINGPSGVWVDGSGNLYIADVNNNRVRMVNTSGVINTIAGTGSASFSGDGGPATAATLNGPGRVYVDGSGNIYISDRNNYRVRKINTSGTITTLAGSGSSGFSGDGGAATAAQINVPYCIESDASGNVYIADLYNNRVRVVNSSGVINTFAGTGAASTSGDGGAATAAGVHGPEGLCWDGSGNFYIGDNTATSLGDDKIRVINTSLIINTFAGTGGTGFSGDGGPATSATFYIPGGLGRYRNAIYVADQFNNRVRRIGLSNSTPSFIAGASVSISMCQNATGIPINTQLAASDSDDYQPFSWTVLSGPSNGSLSGFPYTWLTNGATVTPTGLSYTPTTGYSGTDAFRIIVSDGITSDTITVNATINPAPNPGTISGPTTVCATTTINLTTSGAAGGTWSSSNTSLATVNASGTVTGVAVGSVTITYTITNSCGTAFSIYAITVLPAPSAGSISGPTAVCEGQQITLTPSVGGGSWSATNTRASVASTGIVTGNVAGIDTIVYSVTNSCGTATISYTVTVNPIPNPITGAAAICAGGYVMALGETTTGGTWSTSNGGVATVNSTGFVTSTGAGTANISYTLPATGCYVFVTVTVNALPNPITGPTNVCLGSSITLSTTSTGGTWLTSNAGIASINTTGTVFGASVGAATITYASSTTGCFVTYNVTVTAIPPAITGTTFVCVGVSSLMTNSATGGTWSTSNATIASIDASGNMTGVAVGTATITYTTGGCYNTLNVTVGSSPGPITGPAVVCNGSTVTVSNASTGGTWSSSGTGIASIDATGNVTGVSSGTVTLSYSLGSGCLSTTPFTVNPVPVAIAGPTTVCEGGSTISLTDATVGGTWSTSGAAIASVNGTGTVTGVSAGTATITYDRLGCVATSTITVNPLAPSTITPLSSTALCVGGFVVLTAPTSSTYSYQWYNGGTPISGETNSTYIAYGAGSFTLSIRNSFGCLSSSVPTIITMNPVTASITSSGATTFCSGSSVTLNATTGAGYTYQWRLGSTGIAGATNSSYAAGSSGPYSVVVTNAAGCSAASSSISVTVMPAPSTAVAASGALSFCDGGSVTLTADTGTSYSYQWQLGGVNITGATSITYTATTTGNYQVVVTDAYPCSAASIITAVTAIALPSAAITVTGFPTFCGGGSVPLSVPAAGGNTYQWILNGTNITGATNATYTATAGGSYQVFVTAPTGCTNTTTPPQVLVEMTTPNIVPLTSVNHCWGGTSLLSARTSTTVGIAYQWQFNGTNITGATSATINAGPTGYYSCVVSLIAGACSSASAWLLVTEFPAPNPIVTWDGLHLNTDTTFVTYQWYRNYTPMSGATTHTITPTLVGNYAVQVTDRNGCQSLSPAYPLTSLTDDTTGGGGSGGGGGGGGSTAVSTVDKDDVKIFPNPAQTIINIVANVPLRAVLTAVDGRKVIDVPRATSIDMSNLANGMYMLMLYDKDGQMVKTEKVVKE